MGHSGILSVAISASRAHLPGDVIPPPKAKEILRSIYSGPDGQVQYNLKKLDIVRPFQYDMDNLCNPRYILHFTISGESDKKRSQI